MNLIDLKNISFTYPGSEKPILMIDELIVKKGERIFLFGPSGTGKTTLLEILAGVLSPQKGQVEILGQNINLLKPSDKDGFRGQHLGYIFQSFNLIPYLNVEENISLPLYLNPHRQKKMTAQNVQQEVLQLCQRLGIEKNLQDKVTELSVGQQQRVAVARALLGSPELILADEPTSALDFDHREKFIQLLFEICKEKQTTVLFVSHDRTLQNIFDRSISLSEINKVAVDQSLDSNL